MRVRPSKDAITERRRALYDIVAEQRPMTVRQIYYQATVHGLVDKTEQGYERVSADLNVMRKSGELPYEWIVDGTRSRQHPATYSDVEEALNDTAESYRKKLWDYNPHYVEFWCEKDALSGVLWPVTSKYDVSLMTARGYGSLSFLYEAGVTISETDKPTFIYHLGDFDPSGQDAARDIEAKLRGFAPDVEIHFERLAVTPSQIDEWDLPTRPTKQADTRSKGFGNESVELDAIPPDRLRALVQGAIERHLPPDEYDRLMDIEEQEREEIAAFVRERE